MKLIVIIILISITHLALFAQQNAIRRADAYFAQNAFSKAIPKYESAIQKGSLDPLVYGKLADAYYYIFDAENACQYYDLFMAQSDSTVDVGYYFRYVEALRSLGELSKAEAVMRLAVQMAPNDGRSLRYVNKQEMKEWNDEPFEVELTNMPFNSEFSEYGTFCNGNQLLFVSNRDKDKDNEYWIGKQYASIFFTSKNGNAKVSRYPINTEKNIIDDSGVFSADGKTLYITRSSVVERGLVSRKRSYSTFKIYRFTREGRDWSKPEQLSINSDRYNVANPALDATGKHLYFVSDMDGGFGKSDIYRAPINADGVIGTPENIGDGINTEGRETYIYIDKTNHLYFASDGHWGLGGLDIYRVNLSDSIPLVLNMGVPINSSRDDFSFVKESRDAGFLSSNRDGGVGDDDVYAFRIWEKRHTTIKGTVLNSFDRSPLTNANVILSGNKNVPNDTVTAGVDGKFSFDNVLWLWHSDVPLQRKTIRVEHPLFAAANQNISLRSESVLQLAKPLMLEPTHIYLTYQGRISDQKDNTPLGAFVSFADNGKRQVVSNDTLTGRYSFVASPNISVEVRAEMYQTINRDLPDSLATPDRVVDIDFSLQSVGVGDTIIWQHILFKTAKWDLLPEAFPMLEKLNDFMMENKSLNIAIAGHTDSRGSYSYNQKLSERRASSVANYLVIHGIKKDRITSNGYSFSVPVATNETAQGQLLNRRVEVTISE